MGILKVKRSITNVSSYLSYQKGRRKLIEILEPSIKETLKLGSHDTTTKIKPKASKNSKISFSPRKYGLCDFIVHA